MRNSLKKAKKNEVPKSVEAAQEEMKKKRFDGGKDVESDPSIFATFMAKRVVLHTTQGDIELELWEKIAPLA